MKTPKPFRQFSYYTVTNSQDSSGVSVHFTAEPSPGIYNVINYSDYPGLLSVTWNAHVRLNANNKIYRNYKQVQEVLEVYDSSNTRNVKTAGLWVYAADDHNDSLLLVFSIKVDVYQGVRWSVNGGTPRIGSAEKSSSHPYYIWTYLSDNTDNSFVLYFLSKPGSPGYYRAGFSGFNKIFLSLNLNKFLPSNYDVQKGYHMKETDTNHAVAIAMVPDGIKLSMTQKTIVTAPYISGNPGPPTVYPDTFRISANLLMDHDWE